jgi:hypothetical protein
MNSDRPNCYSRALGAARNSKRAAKKPHPAEIAAEAAMIEAIRNADHFLASLFVGRGEYQVRSARNVREALTIAPLLETAFPTTRKCIIYAVAKDGVATMLTYDLLDKQLALVALPKGFEIVAGKHAGLLTLMRGPTEIAASAQRADLIEVARRKAAS